MKIITKLSANDVIRFNFYLLYRRWIIKILTAFMLIDILLTIYYPQVVEESLPQSLLFPILFLCILPLMTYVRAKRSLKTNRRVTEQIEYAFDDLNLIVSGESFNSTMTWDKVFKVTKTKRWILVWHSKNAANLIPLKDIWDGDILSLKEILTKHSVNNNL